MADEEPGHQVDHARRSRRITWTALALGLIALGIYAGYFVYKYLT